MPFNNGPIILIRQFPQFCRLTKNQFALCLRFQGAIDYNFHVGYVFEVKKSMDAKIRFKDVWFRLNINL